MFATILQAADKGLTFREIVIDVPHDLSALIVYLMLTIFIFLVWWGSKPDVARRYRSESAQPQLESAAAEAVEPHVGAVSEPAQALLGVGRTG